MKPRARTGLVAHRMACTSCGYVGEPVTLIEGSDLLEMFGWCLLGIPGLVYCARRHYLRIKACRLCGDTELMREARGSRSRRLPQAIATDPLVESVCRVSIAWPKHLATPRERVRRCAIPTLAIAAGAVLSAFSGGELAVALAASAHGILIAVGPMGQFALHMVSPSRTRRMCHAWDGNGRTLTIEQV